MAEKYQVAAKAAFRKIAPDGKPNPEDASPPKARHRDSRWYIHSPHHVPRFSSGNETIRGTDPDEIGLRWLGAHGL